MMKHILLTGALVLASAMTGVVMADCVNNRVANGVNSLSSVLSGHTICVSNGSGGWNAQEEHLSGGVLKDYKLGPASPTNQVDPEAIIGSWSTSSGLNATVTYIYTGSPTPYTYAVYLNSGTVNTVGSTYDFCTTPGGTPVVTGSLKMTTGAGCP